MGSAAIIDSDMDTRPELTPWLASVFVAKEFRNQGVGSRLVEHVMEEVRKAGVKERWCRKVEQPVKWKTCYCRMSRRALNGAEDVTQNETKTFTSF
jgi:GNAT superfamily N-acetyltransferase